MGGADAQLLAPAELSPPCPLQARLSLLGGVSFHGRPQFPHPGARFRLLGAPLLLSPLALTKPVSGPSHAESSAFSIPLLLPPFLPSFRFRDNPILHSATRSCLPFSLPPLSSPPASRGTVPGPLCPLLLGHRSLLLSFYLLQRFLVISGRHLFISGLKKEGEKRRKERKEIPFHQPSLL